jgi:hypothetical protein
VPALLSGVAAVELPLRAAAAVAELPLRAEAAVVELPLRAEAVVVVPRTLPTAIDRGGGGTDVPWILRLEDRDSGTTPKKNIFKESHRVRPNPAVRQTVQLGPRRSRKDSLKQEFWLFKRLEYRGRLLEGIIMNSKGAILIVFAWAMEAVGVTGGIVNSTYTTFGENLPNTFVGYIPALPMAVLAIAEFGRVPLASVIFHKHKFMQVIAILGIVALGYLAAENWTFGFERIVDLRLKEVNAASREMSRANAELAALVEHRQQKTTTDSIKRDELRRGADQRDASIAGLRTQLSKEAEVHQKNLEAIREACRIIKDKCIVPRSREEDSRYSAEVDRLSADLALQSEQKRQLQSQIDDLVTRDASELTVLEQRINVATASVDDARKSLRSAADGNQIYRLAANWFGVSTSNVTPEQLAAARWVFSTFSALTVALAGSIAALVYYARNQVPCAPSLLGELITKVARARRAYYARQRRPLKVQVMGPERVVYRDGKEPATIVEKEVPRFIDQIVLIPRWGIKAPIHINSLLSRRNGRNHEADCRGSTGVVSNVTPLGKKVG